MSYRPAARPSGWTPDAASVSSISPNAPRSQGPGVDRIRRFFAREFVGDHVTMDVIEVIDHHGDVIVRARYDGTYDKTNLPDEVILSSYFGLRDGKIVSLTVIHNQPSPY